MVLKADLERDALLREADTARDPHRIAEIQTRLVDIDAHSAPARAAAILSGLGFSTADQARPCSEFSGGWRMRVALAATLFAAPDLLLLDEPTNYLDLEGTLWLEDHLANYPRTVIVISHDRDLLDTSVDQILHLDRGKLTLYRGSYSSFEEQRATREMLDAKQAKRQDAERKRLQAFVDRFKAKASKARQAQSRVKMLERMKPVAALVTQDVREIIFPAPEKILSPPIIAVDDVSVGYDPKSPVLNRVTLRIDNDDRIALLGANGNGKSTLVKLLANRLAPFSGSRHPRGKTFDRLFRAASARRVERGRLALRSRPQADAGRARSQSARPQPARSGFPARPPTPRSQACRAAKRRGYCWDLRPSSAPT